MNCKTCGQTIDELNVCCQARADDRICVKHYAICPGGVSISAYGEVDVAGYGTQACEITILLNRADTERVRDFLTNRLLSND